MTPIAVNKVGMKLGRGLRLNFAQNFFNLDDIGGILHFPGFHETIAKTVRVIIPILFFLLLISWRFHFCTHFFSHYRINDAMN